MSDQKKINQDISNILNHHQNIIDMVQLHLQALYVSQEFILSTILDASPEAKSRVNAALDHVLSHPDLIENRYLLQTLEDMKKRLQRPEALTPEERRSRLYLAWPPKTVPPEPPAD